jgi:hypothetical protein
MRTHLAKEELHRLVEKLPVHELHAAQRFLEYLRHVGSDAVLQALQHAPEDDELETPEEQAAVQEAREQLARGETLPDAGVWQRLGHESTR